MSVARVRALTTIHTIHSYSKEMTGSNECCPCEGIVISSSPESNEYPGYKDEYCVLKEKSPLSAIFLCGLLIFSNQRKLLVIM